jgi:hypothetical protein
VVGGPREKAAGGIQRQRSPHALHAPNYPRAWEFPENQKTAQGSDMLVVLREFNASYRQIFFDGRGFPDDMVPAWSGYSGGHWEGEPLVVESRGFRDDGWLDTNGQGPESMHQTVDRYAASESRSGH